MAMKAYFVVTVMAAVLAGSMQMSADEAISISVRPSVTSFRGSAQLRVIVARDEKNRSLSWEVDGPGYYRASTIELQGASAPRSYVFVVRELPAGEFEVRATVRRSDRTQMVDRTTIRVVGGPAN
jgi:hypothetical protein